MRCLALAVWAGVGMVMLGCSGQAPVSIPTEVGQFYVRHRFGDVELVVNRPDGTSARERGTELEHQLGVMVLSMPRCGSMAMMTTAWTAGVTVRGPWLCENCADRLRMPEGCPFFPSEARGVWSHVGP